MQTPRHAAKVSYPRAYGPFLLFQSCSATCRLIPRSNFSKLLCESSQRRSGNSGVSRAANNWTKRSVCSSIPVAPSRRVLGAKLEQTGKFGEGWSARGASRRPRLLSAGSGLVFSFGKALGENRGPPMGERAERGSQRGRKRLWRVSERRSERNGR